MNSLGYESKYFLSWSGINSIHIRWKVVTVGIDFVYFAIVFLWVSTKNYENAVQMENVQFLCDRNNCLPHQKYSRILLFSILNLWDILNPQW